MTKHKGKIKKEEEIIMNGFRDKKQPTKAELKKKFEQDVLGIINGLASNLKTALIQLKAFKIMCFIELAIIIVLAIMVIKFKA